MIRIECLQAAIMSRAVVMSRCPLFGGFAGLAVGQTVDAERSRSYSPLWCYRMLAEGSLHEARFEMPCTIRL